MVISNEFCEISNEEIGLVNGGGVGGAAIGVVCGFGVGLCTGAFLPF